MSSDVDYSALEQRLDFVHMRMLELHARVTSLEAQGPARAPVWPAQSLANPGVPTPIPDSVQRQAERQAGRERPAEGPAERRAGSSGSSGSFVSSVGPDSSPPEGVPARVLAIAGGSAVLLGLGLWVAYAIEQNWIAPGLRFVLAAIASTVLTLAAWPIARRGYESVAGAIGGAGLGGWFAAWLVARHAQHLVSAPETFAALAVGAAACLLIADRLRLRVMAGLAGLAACATPVLVASGGDRLHELMLYQLLVIVGLIVLDARRRWAELPSLGLLATWALAGAWAERYLAQTNGVAFVGWSAVLLLVSAASAWRLLGAEADAKEQAHGNLRLAISGTASWAAAAAALGITSMPFAAATGVLCVWHLGLAVVLVRRGSAASQLFLGVAWLQAVVLGPIRLDGGALASWWIMLSVAATLIPWSGLQRLRGAMLLIPGLLAVSYCVGNEGPWTFMLGLLAAAVLLTAAMLPSSAEGAGPRPVPGLAIVATLAWTLVVFAHGPATIVAQVGWSLVPVAALLCYACARPTRHAQLVANIEIGLALLGLVAATVDARALELGRLGNPGEQLGIAGLALLLALAGVALMVRVRGQTKLDDEIEELMPITGLGLLTASASTLAALLLVTIGTGASSSLGQVGDSLTIAAAGLGLIIAGLRLGEKHWREVGLALLAVAAAKVVGFDLAAAAVGWRAASFVGLGAISIAGAFAYSRATRRVAVSVAP